MTQPFIESSYFELTYLNVPLMGDRAHYPCQKKAERKRLRPQKSLPSILYQSEC